MRIAMSSPFFHRKKQRRRRLVKPTCWIPANNTRE
jgi:hypothetical protein